LSSDFQESEPFFRTDAQLAHISHVLNHVSVYTDFNAKLKMQKGQNKRPELKY